MARERSPWLLVLQAHGWGVLTEQDLSARVLATGRSPGTPVGDLVTEPAAALPSDRRAADALMFMLESGLRHVPVVDGHRRVLGVVSDTDLVGLPFRSPVRLRSAIQSAVDEEDVAAAGRELPTAVQAMADTGVDAMDAARMVTLIIDAMVRRFLDLAVERLGRPPVPWAWLSLGGAARREQGILTDQDHALAFDLEEESLDEVDRYFLALSTRVTSGLEAAGIPRCKAKVVAEERSLRRPIEHWVVAFEEWMDEPRLEAGRQASILFDFRRTAGDLEAEHTFARVIGSAPQRPRFVRQLAKQAVAARPPVRLAAGRRIDVKADGLTPIVNLARSYALESGVTEPRTLERLKLSAAFGRIDEQTRVGVSEAFRLLWRVRLERHAACVREGQVPDDLVDPRTLGPLTRAELKEAFRIVRHAQRALKWDHSIGRRVAVGRIRSTYSQRWSSEPSALTGMRSEGGRSCG
jgi:CBS domain-containing protein